MGASCLPHNPVGAALWSSDGPVDVQWGYVLKKW